jgi:aminoglycoside phosphotransferase family enzyme
MVPYRFIPLFDAADGVICSRESRMTRKHHQSVEQRDPAMHEVTLAEKVAFLSLPATYPDATTRVEVVETHMSWVFLTELFAHKLKKPVCYEFLDFRSLEARRWNCEEEVRLNRRLAPRVYIGAVPLVVDTGRELQVDGKGEVVDWLVRMRRLPSERMLDRAILQGTVRDGELRVVARLLAEFYKNAVRAAILPQEFRRRLSDAVAENGRALSAPEFGLPADAVTGVCQKLSETVADNSSLFDSRVQHRHVVEGHGDLRPEHVYLGPDPVVIDCLEFNRDFRILDWADELAFLAMECERLGSPESGEAILETCCGELDHHPPAALIHFYKAHRALMRAKLTILHLLDEDVRDPEKWRLRAVEYIGLAKAHAGRPG